MSILRLSVCLFVCFFVSLSVYLICLSIYLSVCLSGYLSDCLSKCLSTYLISYLINTRRRNLTRCRVNITNTGLSGGQRRLNAHYGRRRFGGWRCKHFLGSATCMRRRTYNIIIYNSLEYFKIIFL